MTAGWAAIVGTRDDGRREALFAIAEALRGAGLRVGGVVQEPVLGDDGAPIGYDVIDLASGRRRALARPAADPRLCQWGFDAEAFDEVARWIAAAPFDVIVLPLGSLEAARQGHWATVRRLLEAGRALLLLEIRPRALASVALGLPDPGDGLELPATGEAVAAFAARIAALGLSGRGAPGRR